MKVLVFIVATVLLLSATPARTQSPMVLEGRVVTGSGNEVRPVRRARVTLSGRGLSPPRVVDTDTKGGYRFDDVPRGSYDISVAKPGFVRFAGKAEPGATITMVRGGAIEGVVLDPAGEPLRGVPVAALQPLPRRSDSQMILHAHAYTDDLGRYRLHSLAAGDYFVEASSRDSTEAALLLPGEKRGAETRAYFPAAETIDAAKPVRVTAGRDVSGIDLRLVQAVPAMDASFQPPAPRPGAATAARIVGRVTDAATGKPVRGARLSLITADGGAAVTPKRTNNDGRFEFAPLQGRSYRLIATADARVQMAYGQKRPGEAAIAIQLKDGEAFNADIALPYAGAVEGLLFDEFGDPAPDVLVKVARKSYVAGRYRLVPIERRSNSQTSDDRGRYRVDGLEPGEYYVTALSGAYVSSGATGGFAPTFYPGATEPGGAGALNVGFGPEATPATFALAPSRTVSVSGRVVYPDGFPVTRGSVWLRIPDHLKRMDAHVARTMILQGSFSIRNVPQGQYTAHAFDEARGGTFLGAVPFGSMSLTVGDSDLADVVLTVTAGSRLRGRVVLEDSTAAPPKPDEVRFTTWPVEFDTAPFGAGVPPSPANADWTVDVGSLNGVRRLSAGVSNPSWALKRIAIDDRDVTDVPLDFRNGDVDGVEVVLTPKVSAVSGKVTDDKAKAVTAFAVIVFASDPDKWFERSRFVRLVQPNQYGQFLVRGLPPEDYFAVALPAVDLTEWTDPAFLQQLRPLATSFTLTEGESRTLDLRLKKHP